MNTELIPMLAAVSGQSLINSVIWIVVAGLICWLLWWFIDYVGLPQPFNKFARIVVALFALIVCINALLSLVGKGFISW